MARRPRPRRRDVDLSALYLISQQERFSLTRLIALALTAAALSVSSAHAQPSPDGDWDGALEIQGGMKLALVMHLGDARSTVDSPDQNAFGLPATLSHIGAAITVEMPSVAARFDGAISPDGRSLDGGFTQSGRTLPLHFARRAAGAPSPMRNRPQTPQPPFPYSARDVSFPSPGGVLAGTLSRPPGAGPFPAVVMIAGSGPQTRDEAVEGHKIFLVIADRLTRAGVAVLRYDKRGIGASTGSYATATGADFTADAEAAVAWLRAQPGIARVGLIGHSEGAEIAPRVADQDPGVAFVVLLAAPAIPGYQTILTQQRAIMLASGARPAEVEAQGALEQRLLEAVRAAPDAASAQAAAEKALAEAGMRPERAAAEARGLASPWYREFLNDDPAPALRRLRQPTLVVAGSKDLQILPDLNLPVIRAALADNKDAKIVELDGLNHLLQPATTGAPSEYGDIPVTVAPAALDLITDWVVERSKRP